ncbi:MAG: PhnD/SsuA/transferrin family substrate-binding protein [Burkholderiales bacterium]
MFPNGNAWNRRRTLATGIALAASPLAGRAQGLARVREDIRIGTTPVFLDDQFNVLNLWKRYFEERLNRKVSFVQRRSYQEITELLLTDQIEAAWVCSPPYLMNVSHLRLLCVPIYEGLPLYHSYLIVPKDDTRTHHITDLRGRIYAFSDPQSNSGCLVPKAELLRAGFTPGQFFLKYFFTYSHRRVVDAVSVRLADGGSVDGYVWDTMKKELPGSTDGTRVAWSSPHYGFPPLVARSNLPQDKFRALQDAFVAMKDNAPGRVLLDKLNLDGFAREDPSVFASVKANLQFVGDL